MADSATITSLTVGLFSTLGGLIPLFLGLLAANLASRGKDRFRAYGPALSVGVILSIFYDLLQETAGLQLGALNPIPQAATVIMFLIGILTLQLIPAKRKGPEFPTRFAYGWALGIGLHGLGEGIIIGYGFITGQTAFFNVSQILGFGLHKIGEGFTLGTLLAIPTQKMDRWSVSGLIAGLPVGFGGVLGFLTNTAELSTYSFAIGAGFAAYFTIQFSRLLPVSSRVTYGWVSAGFLYMYLAGLLHQF